MEQRYIYGNTARQETAAERRVNVRDRQRSEVARKTREEALRMELPYLVLLTLASVVTLFICCSYLRVQSSITQSLKNIEAQERRLEALKNENDALETRINTSINLDHVYNVATKELGMVYAKKDQVITYDRTESEYVRQYDNIPE